MRLIDADKLNDILINISEHLQQEGTVVSGPMHKFYEHFIDVVKNQTTVEPVKHAHVIVDWLGNCTCFGCGYRGVDSSMPYCANCGARLDEPEEREG